MVEVALSFYGSNRFWHVLGRCKYRFCLLGAATLALTACSEGGSQPTRNAADYPDQFRQQAEVIAQGLKRLRESPSTKDWLVDSSTPAAFVQPGAPFETWLFLALMRDQHGRRYAMQQRLARLKVTDERAEAISQWNFSDVLALDYRLEPVGGHSAIDTHTVQQADRVALSLAGTSAAQSKLWIGGFTTTKTTKKTTQRQCEASYSIQTPQLNLLFEQFSCASEQRASTFLVTRSESMRVSGEYRFQGRDLVLDGRGWLERAWGVPPDTNQSAVVFDRAWLWLEDTADIQLQRSRRRSGRGPMISTGSVSKPSLSGRSDVGRDQTAPSTLTQVVFADGAAQIGTHTFPSEFRLTEPSHAIDVVLTSTHTPETAGGIELNRLMAVAIEGSHTGVGFVSYAVTKGLTSDVPE